MEETMAKHKLGAILSICVVVGLVSLGLSNNAPARAAESGHGPGPAVDTRQLHKVIDHGLDMLMGANMVMLGQMQMSPGLDQQVVKHGRSLMDSASQGLQQLTTGPGQEGRRQGSDAAPMAEYVKSLAALLRQVADSLEEVKLEEKTPDATTMHYFNIIINQAMELALQGSQLIVSGKWDMSEHGEDGEAVARGRKMLEDSRMMIIEIMGSKSMAEMHSRGSGKMPAMGLTHQLTGEALKLMDLLDSIAR
jgi:hypothetical protein